MSGLFARWQPCYAEHGIPTFPVRFEGIDKRPAVKGYLKLGLDLSRQLTIKLPADDAFGFALSRRTHISVLDVDTTDERLRDEAFARHGEPAIVVRTLRGHWQGWYRRNGELRRIKAWPNKPVDILGGGFVCAPPSQGLRSGYAFVQGGLDDLAHLTTLCNLDLPRGGRGHERIPEGLRNDSLFNHCMRQAHHCDDLATLIDMGRTYAEDALDLMGETHRFTEAEIVRTATSAWRITCEGRNRFGLGAVALIKHCEIDTLLAENQDAVLLLIKLRRHHWGRDFALAKSIAATFKWGQPRFRAARECLVRHGIIQCVHAGGQGPHDPAKYRWAKGVWIDPQ